MKDGVRELRYALCLYKCHRHRFTVILNTICI